MNPLLSEFVRTGSEGAFRDLVSGYVNLVYSTAVRSVRGDTQLAEDIVQHVFIDLAREAVTLSPNIQLGGWLYRHTCFLARNAMRGERRRKARERKAIELQRLKDYTDENLHQLTGILDEVINELGAEDRTAILLRFFEQLEFRSIGIAMGRSEDAARMRVSRALEKLGSLLRRRGFILSTASLGYVMGTKVLRAAPNALVDNATRAGIASAFKGTSYLSLLKDTCLTRVNVGLMGATVGVVLATLMLLGGRHLKDAEQMNQPRQSVTKESVEVASASSPEPEVAVPITNTPPAPKLKPITRSSAPEIAVRKVTEIRNRKSSNGELVEPVNGINQAPVPPGPALTVVPIVVNSQKYVPNANAASRSVQKSKAEPLSSPQTAQSGYRSRSSNVLAPTSATTKRLVTVPGRSNPATPSIKGNAEMQWVPANHVGLPIRVMDGTLRRNSLSSRSGLSAHIPFGGAANVGLRKQL